MRHVVWLLLPTLLAGCGGGSSPATLSVVCGGGTKLVGAASVEVLGELDNGRPTMEFPDPANPGKDGTISVQPHERCKITPSGK